MRDKDNFRMIGFEQQNEVLQQVKQIELVAPAPVNQTLVKDGRYTLNKVQQKEEIWCKEG